MSQTRIQMKIPGVPKIIDDLKSQFKKNKAIDMYGLLHSAYATREFILTNFQN